MLGMKDAHIHTNTYIYRGHKEREKKKLNCFDLAFMGPVVEDKANGGAIPDPLHH